MFYYMTKIKRKITVLETRKEAFMDEESWLQRVKAAAEKPVKQMQST